MGLRPLVVSDCVASGHPTVAPNYSMSSLVTLSLWIGAPSSGNGGIGIESTFLPVNCPHAVCQPQGHSNRSVDGFFVPSAVHFQSSDFTSSELHHLNSL